MNEAMDHAIITTAGPADGYGRTLWGANYMALLEQ